MEMTHTGHYIVSFQSNIAHCVRTEIIHPQTFPHGSSPYLYAEKLFVLIVRVPPHQVDVDAAGDPQAGGPETRALSSVQLEVCAVAEAIQPAVVQTRAWGT